MPEVSARGVQLGGELGAQVGCVLAVAPLGAVQEPGRGFQRFGDSVGGVAQHVGAGGGGRAESLASARMRSATQAPRMS